MGLTKKYWFVNVSIKKGYLKHHVEDKTINTHPTLYWWNVHSSPTKDWFCFWELQALSLWRSIFIFSKLQGCSNWINLEFMPFFIDHFCTIPIWERHKSWSQIFTRHICVSPSCLEVDFEKKLNSLLSHKSYFNGLNPDFSRTFWIFFP